jgi:hypothetical protein
MTWRSGTSYGPCPARFVSASDVKKAYFIEQALQNRTRADANRTGVVFSFSIIARRSASSATS